jgi:hypothetical protein
MEKDENSLQALKARPQWAEPDIRDLSTGDDHEDQAD